MKRLIWVSVALLMAAPAFAQDDVPSSPFAGGNGQQVFTRVDEVNPMDSLKAFLGKARITLSGDQEKAIKPAVDAAMQQMQEATTRLGPQPGRGADGGGRGGRRGGPGADPNSPLNVELRKINDDLVTKITAVLKPDQQAVFKKYQNDQIKAAGGFGALKVTMQEAGAALTPDQETQIQSVYAEDAQQHAQLLRESQGRPDAAKVADLDRATMTKVARILNAAQRKALLDSRAKAQPQ
ncbi:MAG TPA: hypothetical protein VE422_31965 [Terriglobia bacterium]|nr:hypothetical protein [Terriglobia bacterium]